MKEKTLTRIRKFTEDSQDLLDKLNLDVDEIVDMKMAMNEKKYPIDKCNQ